MTGYRILLLSLLSLSIIQAQDFSGQQYSRWTKDQANEWYANQPWPCGFNYVPANAISYTDFHSYGNADIVNKLIEELVGYKRPVINTEWLCRHRGSVVSACLPLFREKNVGCMHWGLVNGKTQTDLHWGWRPDMGEPDVWQHDLFFPDHTPYREDEIKIFKTYIQK